MIVTAALVWYDERPEDLEACIRGMATIADRVVAVDGAYRRYPGAQIASAPEQAEAIRDTAAAVGLEAIIRIPTELWAGQVAKRSYLLAEAAHGSDWIAIFDADWVATGDRDAVRAELAGYGPGIDTVSVSFWTPPPEGSLFATGWHRKESGRRYPIRHLFRALPGIRVEKRHWHYSAMKNGRRVWLWHGRARRRRPTIYEVLPEHQLAAPYEIEHRTLLRTERQILASRAFCNDRERVLALTGQEDDVPGLPAPAFDFVTVPY